MSGIRKFADIHSHIIFGADDGAQDLGEAVELLKQDRDEGALVVFATPHYGREAGFTPDAAGVMQKFELLRERAAREVPEVRLYLGTEWYCAWTLAGRIRRREGFRMNGTEYVLVEFLESASARETAEKILANLAELQRGGFRPILAHPERYATLQEDWDLLRQITDSGVLLQVSAYDLFLNLSLKTRQLARWLAKERLVSFLGSDMHGLPPRRDPRMKEGVAWLYENTDGDYADAVAFGNAEKLLGAGGA